MFPSIPFLSGEPDSRSKPLARYLPPVEKGVAKTWLKKSIPSFSETDNPDNAKAAVAPWILDPFGASPQIAVEVAQAGFRLLVAANNPVTRFLLEIAANPPQRDELQAALAELSTLRKGDERLEPHIRSLYLTHCDECGEEVMAEAFLWDRGSGVTTGSSSGPDLPQDEAPFPFARIYHCPACGESGEHPTKPEDIERAAQFSSSGLHHSRALERVARRDDPDRHHAEEALATYLPRAVYALFTLINKLESLPATTNQRQASSRRALDALVLAAFDQANTLWPYPTGRARPRQLSIPPRFWEKNIWLALEDSIELWTQGEDFQQEIPISTWPELPPETGGICLFEGRLKDLAEQIGTRKHLDHVDAVLAALPRPNQAFWTLSALWSGWLWGREAVGPFKNVLRRRRYDWSWHATALEAALEHLSHFVKNGTPYLGLIGEAEPGFLSAALISADSAHFDLTGLALRGENGQAQILWRLAEPGESAGVRESATPSGGASTTVDFAAQAARSYLIERGEPANYLNLHTAALMTVIKAESMDRKSSPADRLNRLNVLFDDAFSYRHGFLRYGGSHKNSESGVWWLRELGLESPEEDFLLPLSDRVEMNLVNYLVKNNAGTFLDIDHRVCEEFPGLLTPEGEFVLACLESYAERVVEEKELWVLRSQELPKFRREDLAAGLKNLRKIAKRLDLNAKGRVPLLWLNREGQAQYALYITASAVIGKLILTNPYPPEKTLLVVPEERAGLIAYKIRQDPRLQQKMNEGWRFISLRQLTWIAEQPNLTQKVFNDQLSQDITEFYGPQMRLL